LYYTCIHALAEINAQAESHKRDSKLG
jgi:hypothetical protein